MELWTTKFIWFGSSNCKHRFTQWNNFSYASLPVQYSSKSFLDSILGINLLKAPSLLSILAS